MENKDLIKSMITLVDSQQRILRLIDLQNAKIEKLEGDIRKLKEYICTLQQIAILDKKKSES